MNPLLSSSPKANVLQATSEVGSHQQSPSHHTPMSGQDIMSCPRDTVDTPALKEEDKHQKSPKDIDTDPMFVAPITESDDESLALLQRRCQVEMLKQKQNQVLESLKACNVSVPSTSRVELVVEPPDVVMPYVRPSSAPKRFQVIFNWYRPGQAI